MLNIMTSTTLSETFSYNNISNYEVTSKNGLSVLSTSFALPISSHKSKE